MHKQNRRPRKLYCMSVSCSGAHSINYRSDYRTQHDATIGYFERASLENATIYGSEHSLVRKAVSLRGVLKWSKRDDTTCHWITVCSSVACLTLYSSGAQQQEYLISCCAAKIFKAAQAKFCCACAHADLVFDVQLQKVLHTKLVDSMNMRYVSYLEDYISR